MVYPTLLDIQCPSDSPPNGVRVIGSITAHYRFGARTAKSSYVIGGVCIALALLGRAAVGLLHLIPLAVLASHELPAFPAAYLLTGRFNPRRQG